MGIVWLWQCQTGDRSQYHWQTVAVFSAEALAKEATAQTIQRQQGVSVEWQRGDLSIYAGDYWEASYRLYKFIDKQWVTYHARLVQIRVDEYVAQQASEE